MSSTQFKNILLAVCPRATERAQKKKKKGLSEALCETMINALNAGL